MAFFNSASVCCRRSSSLSVRALVSGVPSTYSKDMATITPAKSQGMKQLMAGGGVALIGVVLVPLLSGLFG